MKELISFYKDKHDKKGVTGSVEQALNRIRQGYRKKEITLLRTTTDKSAKDKIKLSLSAVTFSGHFSERLDDKLVKHSGYIVLDFDKVSDLPNLKETLLNWDYTVAAWLSPSGTGYKALVRVQMPEKHREHFNALEYEWKKMGFEIDKACKNESRLCFESYDPDIYVNITARTYTKFGMKEYTSQVAPITQKEKETDEYEKFNNLKKWAAKNGHQFIEGNRNNFVMKMGGACARFGIPENIAAGFIRNDFVLNDKSFADQELLATVKSAYRVNKAQFGTQAFEKDKIVNVVTKKEDPEMKIFDTQEKVADIVRANDVKDKIKKFYKEGYVGAETTHIPDLDPLWKWVRGESNLFTGIGNSGKSTLLRQMMLIKSLKSQTKWVIFAPEDFPAEQFFWELVEMLMGQACTPNMEFRPEYAYIEKAIEFINDHFFYIEASENPTPKYVKTKFMECVILYGCDGCLIDPFNQLYHDYAEAGGRDDRYLEETLPEFHKFAKAMNIFLMWVAHPKSLQMKKGENNYPCPEVFDIAGGAMWNNKIDNILILHRPNGQSDPDDPTVELHIKKIRFSNRTGRRGILVFYYHWRMRRYIFPYMNQDPEQHPLADFINNTGIESKKPGATMKPNHAFDEDVKERKVVPLRNYSEPTNDNEENFAPQPTEDPPPF